MSTAPNMRRLGLLVGGGPAPGINGVISAVTLEALNNGVEVYGIRDGFKYLVQENLTKIRRLHLDDVNNIHLRGGSILGTSRTNPTKPPEDLPRVVQVLQQLELDGLVTIGGDDTAYSASQVYKHMGGKIRVAHVPKTIDNDLPLHASTPTFGFETARQVGTQIVRNLAEDARTTSRWHLIVSMGRAAGHLALGIGKSAAATLTIIPEEFRGRQVTLTEVCDIILGSIIRRVASERYHGVVILAEGLLEAIGAEALTGMMGEETVGKYGQLSRDPHGHLRLGQIDFGRMIRDLLSAQLDALGLKTSFISKDLGYELRCADPIPFDAQYTRDLGYGAFKFLRSPAAAEHGAIISYVEGRMVPLRFEDVIDPRTNRMRNRKVDVDGEGYESARRYMIRLEKDDFDNPDRLNRVAAVVKMKPEQFRERFGYLVNG